MHKPTLATATCTLLVLVVLSGCASHPEATSPPPFDASTLSAKLYKVLPPVDIGVPSAVDGKLLDNAVYRPDVPNGTRVPVYINFSPYHGDTAMTKGDNFAHYLIDEYVPRGYAVVLSAVRGTGHSQGCFQIGGDLELKDTYDVVDYFSKQPWSNGNIGAGAKSYDSTTQNGMIAKYPHPALKTILHVSGITDMYRYNYRDGVPYAQGLDFTPTYYLPQGLDEYLGVTTGAGSTSDETPDSLQRAADDAACPELPHHVASAEGSGVDGMKDAYWQERDWVHFLPQSKWSGSVLFVHGFSDWNVKPDNFDPWLEELQAKHIEVKGWLHQWQQAGTGHVYPMRTDFNLTMLRWLDHYLKGKDTGIDHELGFDMEDNQGVWRHSATWPPAGTNEPATATFFPTTLTPPGAQNMTLGPQGNAQWHLIGVPTIDVEASATTSDPVLRAALYLHNATGTYWVDEAVRRVTLSDDLSAVEPYTPGAAVHKTLTFYPVDIVVPSGSTLEVRLGIGPEELAGDAASQSPGEPTPPNLFFASHQAQVTYGTVTLHLPVTDAASELAPQPAPMFCWAC